MNFWKLVDTHFFSCYNEIGFHSLWENTFPFAYKKQIKKTEDVNEEKTFGSDFVRPYGGEYKLL